jgi:hypothetical protein
MPSSFTLFDRDERPQSPADKDASHERNEHCGDDFRLIHSFGHLLSRRRMDENDSWILCGVTLGHSSAGKLERSEAHVELSVRNRKAGGIVALRLAGFENL